MENKPYKYRCILDESLRYALGGKSVKIPVHLDNVQVGEATVYIDGDKVVADIVTDGQILPDSVSAGFCGGVLSNFNFIAKKRINKCDKNKGV